MEFWQIVLIVVLAVFVLLLTFAYLVYRMAFWRRCDRNPNIKYFSAEDFNLNAESIAIGRLRGAVYSKDGVAARDGIVVFAHGMGPGHVAYTTEIAYFCNLGYKVVAVDSLGCNLSGGRRIRGLYEGAKTAVAAIDFAHANFPDKPVYLVGHSWGAYSVLCASRSRKVDKVVAISAPLSPTKTLYDGSSKVLSKPVAAILYPFWGLINFLMYGAKGNSNAAKCAAKSGAPTLVIHGDKDDMVGDGLAAYTHVKGDNITKYAASGKGHNPYNTATAEAKLAELTAKLKNGEKDFSEFDFGAATQEDEEVMKVIADFIAS